MAIAPRPGHNAVETRADGSALRATRWTMIKVNYDAEHNAVIIDIEGNIDDAQAKQVLSDLQKILSKTRKGFKLLADLSRVESMELDVQSEVGKAMDFLNAKGVSEIFRVLPDPDLDIAFNVMSAAHYSKQVRVHTYRCRAEAEVRLQGASYVADRSALLIVDPYNDYMSEGGKFYEATKATAESADFYDHMRMLIPAVREAGIQIVIVPHRRWREGDYRRWKHMNPTQAHANRAQAFAFGSWGGEFHPEFGPRDGDVVALEHWAMSGFANTDLDAQLKQRGIENIILVGMAANTCVEGTARLGMELGYHVTLVKDATAAFDRDGMRAAHEINGPRYAHSILTSEELRALLPAPEYAGSQR
jgi:nicotinamidase-related amidase